MDAQTLEKAMEAEKRSDSWCGVEGIKKNLLAYFTDIYWNKHTNQLVNRKRWLTKKVG